MSKEKKSIIDMFLNDFGITNGKIKIGEEEKDFNDLSLEVQYNVLKGLVGNSQKGLYDLSEDEVSTVNFLRENKTTLNDFVNSEVEKGSRRASEFYELQSEDYKNMPDDMIYKKNLLAKNADLSDEEINRKLEVAKETDSYKDVVNDLREIFDAEQDVKIKKAQKVIDDDNFDKLEKQREFITNEVIPIDYVSDWKVTDETKEEILGKLLETSINREGQENSIFLNEITDNPENLFKAAHNYYKGDDFSRNLDTYYKMKLNDATSKIKEEVIKGTELVEDRIPFEVNKNTEIKEDENKKEGARFGAE